jgi:hypothetical protein
MSLVVAPNSVAELFVVKARRKRLKVMIGVLLLGLLAFGERCGTTSVGDRVKGVAIGNGGMVDFGHEAVIELLLLFGLRAVLTVK